MRVPFRLSRRDVVRSRTARRPAVRSAILVAATSAVALTAVPAPAAAQQRPTDRARATLRPQDAPRKQSFVADLGYVNTSGNTRVTTVNVGNKYNLSTGRWRFEQFAALVYGENDGAVNTNFIRAGAGGEYAITSWFGVAAGVLYDRNRFAGISQRLEQYVGLVWRLSEGERDSLRFDAGTSRTQQLGTDGARQGFPAARSAFWYKRVLAPKAFVQQSVEMIPNLQTNQDYRVNSSTQLVSPVAGRMALRLEYLVRYDNLPEPDFRSTDRIFTTGVQFTF